MAQITGGSHFVAHHWCESIWLEEKQDNDSGVRGSCRMAFATQKPRTAGFRSGPLLHFPALMTGHLSPSQPVKQSFAVPVQESRPSLTRSWIRLQIPTCEASHLLTRMRNKSSGCRMSSFSKLLQMWQRLDSRCAVGQGCCMGLLSQYPCQASFIGESGTLRCTGP